MIVEIFFLLIGTALLSLVLTQGTKTRLMAIVSTLLMLSVFLFMIINSHLGGTDIFIYQWIPYQDLHANLNLSSHEFSYDLMLPLFLITLLIMGINASSLKEQISLSLNALLCFNLAAFMLLLCSKDFIQLMVGSSMLSIIAFYLINDMSAKKKFVFYNLLADMAIFTALAIIYSQIGKVELSELYTFYKIGAHKDLIAILIILSLSLKMGLFLFQNQFIDLQNISLKRILSISFLSTPLATFVLAVKLAPLITIFEYSQLLLNAILLMSVIWGMVGAWIIDSLKAKIFYLNMIFYAFVLMILLKDYDSLSLQVPYMLMGQFLLMLCLVMVIKSASNEVYVSQMGGFFKSLKFSFFVTLLMVAGVISGWWAIMLNDNYNKWCLFVLLLPFASIMQQIYGGKSRADEWVSALLKNPSIIFWLPILLIGGGAVYYFKGYQNIAVVQAVLVFVAFMILNPLRFVKKWSDNELVQESDFLEKIYNVFIMIPIRLLGRVLWLTIDFMFIERTIMGSIGQGCTLVVRGLQKGQMANWINYLVMVTMGLLIIVIMVGYKYYE